MVTIENPATKFIRYLYLPNLDDMAGLTAAINDAKTKAETLTDRIRQQKGLAPAGGSSAPAAASASPAPSASAPVSAPRPVSIPTPVAKEEDVSTVAMSGMADDPNLRQRLKN